VESIAAASWGLKTDVTICWFQERKLKKKYILPKQACNFVTLPFHRREEQEQWREESNRYTHQLPLCSWH